MASDFCNICSIFLGSSKKTKLRDIVELLEALLVQVNCKLLEELLICDICVIKVQSACKFKASYLENLCIKLEDVKNEAVRCEICKESVKSMDCIPLFYSVTEIDKLNLFKFLSSDLQLRSKHSAQTCELCHKSILNFCIVIRSFSVFACDIISNQTGTFANLKSHDINSGRCIIEKCLDSTGDCAMDIKEEDAELKEEQVSTSTYEDFLCKNEEVDLKTEDEPVWSHTHQEVGTMTCVPCDSQTKNNHINHMSTRKSVNEIKRFKCEICKYQTKHECRLNKHLIVHKNSREVETFKCNICDFQTKYKSSLYKHRIVHKNSDEVEMFQCEICNYRTKHKGYIKQHQIVHKNSSEIEMFKCEICQFQTKYKRDFKKHLDCS